MQNEYKGSWAIPATAHPVMLSDMKKAVRNGEHSTADEPIQYGKGTETPAISMVFGIRMKLAEALAVETGILDEGGRLATEIAAMQYDFTRSALGEDNVESAEIDFAVTQAVIIGNEAGVQELHLTTTSSIHRTMKGGEKKFHMSAKGTMVLPLKDVASAES